MKYQDKEKILNHLSELTKSMIVIFMFSKLFKRKKANKRKDGIIKTTMKTLFSIMLNDLVINKIKAKVNPHASATNYSWILDSKARNNVIDLTKNIKSLDRDSRVLDLGCGYGRFSIEISKNLGFYGKVFSLDISYDALNRLKNKIEEKNIKNIELHRADIEKLPFPDNYFDAAFLNLTLGQIPNKLKAVSEIYRVLKKDGHLYVSDMFVESHYCSQSTVLSYTTSVGFKPVSEKGNLFTYVIALKK